MRVLLNTERLIVGPEHEERESAKIVPGEMVAFIDVIGVTLQRRLGRRSIAGWKPSCGQDVPEALAYVVPR